MANNKVEDKLCLLRFGHSLPLRAVRRYLYKLLFPHANFNTPHCVLCIKANHLRTFRGRIAAADSVGRLHCNTKGQVDVTCDDGHKYFITIVEDYSRYTHDVPLKSMYEYSNTQLHFIQKF